jgi:hypothetical protein
MNKKRQCRREREATLCFATLAEGVVVDFDPGGNVIGSDLEQASTKLDLKVLEPETLSTQSVTLA